jgi:hypothetical protein
VELYDLSGNLVKALRRDPDWFPPMRALPKYGPRNPPSPQTASVEQTGDGLVWVAVNVADREWWRGLGPLREGESGSWYDVDRIQRFYDTVIEVLDPRSDRLVAVTRVDAALTALIGGA